jgi:hypothetical protein
MHAGRPEPGEIDGLAAPEPLGDQRDPFICKARTELVKTAARHKSRE